MPNVAPLFRRLPSAPQSPASPGITVIVDGIPTPAEAGETVAALLLRLPFAPVRTTPVAEEPRAPFCLMGVCFDCLAVVDGAPSTQTCLMPVRDGMRVERQFGRPGESHDATL